MVRTRFAPSPTGFMHIGNLRTALYEYLMAKANGGKFILRIEDTDQERYVEGSTEVIFKTLKLAGIFHDEGPDVGGPFGPYVQSQRKNNYLDYAKQLVEKGAAYYCFCDKERLDSLQESAEEKSQAKYDRHCLSLPAQEIEAKLEAGTPYVIRQRIPDGITEFHDEVYGEIRVENKEMEDQILIKSDGLPTYNFANVIDDHLMEITHVIRGSEYLSSTPKYNLLYEAFGWSIPTYIHLPLILNSQGEKLSKRKGDASFEDLIEQGYLPEAVVNLIALLGWSPGDNREFFTMEELIQAFNTKGLSKSPAVFDLQKLKWMNGEYIKRMAPDEYFDKARPHLEESVKKPDADLKRLAEMTRTRVEFIHECGSLLDFIDQLPQYSTDLFIHKKMKTTKENSLENLEKALPFLEGQDDWAEQKLHDKILELVQQLGIKNGQMLWPIRTALSGKPTTPCGATELLGVLGKEESLVRIRKGIEMLRQDLI